MMNLAPLSTGRWLAWMTVTAVVGGVTMAASAAPFNYLEAIDGELPASFYTGSPSFGDIAPEPTHVGTADVGANTVSGTTASNPGGDPNTDRDGFKFTVPTGLTIDSIFISIAQADTNDSQTLRFDLYGPSGFADPFEWKPLGDTILSVISPNAANGALFPIPGGPLTEGVYAIVVFNLDINPTPSDLIYAITLTATPEPGTAVLCVLGLGVMLVRRRQRVHSIGD